MTVNTTDRLAALRSLMKERNVDIYGTPCAVLRQDDSTGR